MSVSSSLLFDHCLWLLLLMPCLGLILTYFTKRTKPYRKNGKIYRHDVAARGTLASCFRHAVSTDLGHHHGIELLYQFCFNQ